MKIFDKLSQAVTKRPRPIMGLDHLFAYMDAANGEYVTGRLKRQGLDIIIDPVSQEISEQPELVSFDTGTFRKISAEQPGEAESVIFVPEDTSRVLEEGIPAPVIIATAGRLTLAPELIEVTARHPVPVP